MNNREEIGRVSRLTIEREDHGILTCNIAIDFGGSGQGYGGYSLDGPAPDRKGRAPTLFAGAVLLHLVDFFGGDLDKAKGTPVVVYREGGMIQRIARLACDRGAVLDFKALAAEYAK